MGRQDKTGKRREEKEAAEIKQIHYLGKTVVFTFAGMEMDRITQFIFGLTRMGNRQTDRQSLEDENRDRRMFVRVG